MPQETCWRVVPLTTPRVLRHCSRCEALRPFRSSDRFRINAQQRRVDVWLVYGCTVCDQTWNCSLFERCAPEEIEAALYQRLLRNDRATAWGYAFDARLLRRLGARLDPELEYRVERAGPRAARVRLELAYPVGVRLDRLLAGELAVSRSRLQRWFERGELRVEPESSHALRRPIRDGQRIILPEAASSPQRVASAQEHHRDAGDHEPHAR